MLLKRRAGIALCQGAISKARRRVTTLNADSLRNVLDSRSWVWPPISSVFYCWWTRLGVKRFHFQPSVSALTTCTIQASTEPSNSSDRAIPCSVSLHASQGLKLGRGFVPTAALGSSKYAWCLSPACSQVRKKPCHAMPCSLWKHGTTEAIESQMDHPATHLCSWQYHQSLVAEGKRNLSDARQMHNLLRQDWRVSTESAAWPPLDPMNPLAPAHWVTFPISLARLCC